MIETWMLLFLWTVIAYFAPAGHLEPVLAMTVCFCTMNILRAIRDKKR